ncbi:transposase IS3/IS911-family, orfA [Hyphomonas oceanitis SCH89]|uniref:Transposase IS3/IS911-family, orfA n=1 Tax=Hyphomonas oceanitis SCH89 TaxID=1280953 RepID=A0A059G2P7_9PROT|nr:transposase IS3/IS911-family, orfA [Hyphomonas oceanitis SCH89]
MGKRAKPEEIIAKLREVQVRLARGETTAAAARAVGVTEQTYYRWRREYGGLQVGQAKRMKEMEKENARFRRAVSDLTLDNQILQEVVRGAADRRSQSFKPFTTPGCGRSRCGRAWCLRAPSLPRDRPAPLDPALARSAARR